MGDRFVIYSQDNELFTKGSHLWQWKNHEHPLTPIIKNFNSLILSCHTWNISKKGLSRIFTACRSDLDTSWKCFSDPNMLSRAAILCSCYHYIYLAQRNLQVFSSWWILWCMTHDSIRSLGATKDLMQKAWILPLSSCSEQNTSIQWLNYTAAGSVGILQLFRCVWDVYTFRIKPFISSCL